MANVEKIIGEILSDAETKAKENEQAANEQAEKIINLAKEKCQKIEMQTNEQVAEILRDSAERTKSSSQLKKRQKLLAARQDVIAEILQKAYESFFTMADEEYFLAIEKMLKKSCQAKDGEIYFSEKDLQRMPADFEQIIDEVAREKRGTLTLSKDVKPIDGGFVLVYGGIEENCSIQAMFHTEKEFLADKVQELLF